MFNWVKKLFGTESANQDKYFVDGHGDVQEVVVAPKKAENYSHDLGGPVLLQDEVKTKKTVATKTAKHTKASLGKLTKVQIDELAKSDLGVDLDRRKTKDDMIKDFLAAQKK